MTPHEGLRTEYLARGRRRAALPRNPARRACILSDGGFA
jgi:hypothetical protein